MSDNPKPPLSLHEARQQIAIHKLGRNDRCPCESGKKVKRCCGEAEPNRYNEQLAKINAEKEKILAESKAIDKLPADDPERQKRVNSLLAAMAILAGGNR